MFFNFLITGTIIQILLYILGGVLFNNYKIHKRIFLLSFLTYLLIGIALTIKSSYSDIRIGDCGNEVFNSLVSISILGNFFNVGIFGFCFLIIKFLKVSSDLLHGLGFNNILLKVKSKTRNLNEKDTIYK